MNHYFAHPQGSYIMHSASVLYLTMGTQSRKRNHRLVLLPRCVGHINSGVHSHSNTRLYWYSTLPMLRLFTSKAQGLFNKQSKPCYVAIIGKLSLSTLRWVAINQGFSHFSGFLYNFLLAKLAIISIRVKGMMGVSIC